MKIYTCRKTNEVGQRAIDCLNYMSLSLDETCAIDFDNRCTCKVRLGQVCECFAAGIGTKLYKG